MPESPQGGEKTEQPTPKRLSDARDEGQVANSLDITSAALLLAGFCAFAATGTWFAHSCAVSLRYTITDALPRDLSDSSLWHDTAAVLMPLGLWTIALCGGLSVIAIITSVAQVGFHLSAKALMPKMTKINPITGFGRIFGLRGLMRFVTNVLKIIAVLLIAWLVIGNDIARTTILRDDLGYRIAADSWMLFLLALKLASAVAIIAALDFVYQRYQHTRDLMMTKQEVKEEMKQSEGDPLVKAKVRQIQRQMAQRRMMQDVPKADVVITNPTHVAIALKYDQGKMAAPVVLAKGYDDQAQRIKQIAAAHGIPLVENVPLARALAKEVPVGKAIAPRWYQAVAEVLAAVYKLKRGAA
jgi:flagellar biosynthetic protein FlhB